MLAERLQQGGTLGVLAIPLVLPGAAPLPLIGIVTQWFRRNVRQSYRVVRGWIGAAHHRSVSPTYQVRYPRGA